MLIFEYLSFSDILYMYFPFNPALEIMIYFLTFYFEIILDLQKCYKIVHRVSIYSFLCDFNDFYFFHYSWFTVLCQFSTVQQSDSFTHTYSDTYTHTHIYILFLILSSIMFHHKWLDIVPSATGSHCLSKFPYILDSASPNINLL